MLLETAARLIVEEGPGGLTLRRLAGEVGTSTMAIYTHFGSMTELRREVRREGFSRLADHLSRVDETGDTVADLAMLGHAYIVNAIRNPHLYRSMFMEHIDDEDRGVGIETFMMLVAAVERCMKSGRFNEGDANNRAMQLWSCGHGAVALHLAGILSEEETFATFMATTQSLVRAFGDDPRSAGRSWETTRRRAGQFVQDSRRS